MNKDLKLKLSKNIQDVYVKLKSEELVKRSLDFIKEENHQTLLDQIAITSIPAPSYKEEKRGKDFKRRFEDIGLENRSREYSG